MSAAQLSQKAVASTDAQEAVISPRSREPHKSEHMLASTNARHHELVPSAHAFGSSHAASKEVKYASPNVQRTRRMASRSTSEAGSYDSGMLRTPDLSHLSHTDLKDVYEPAEDSFLFLDALESEMEALRVNLRPTICLEVGCGSGVISNFLAMHLESPCRYICTDLNPMATEATRQTSQRNSVASLECLTCNLADPLKTRLEGCVDIILFNPPYVVTPSEEVASSLVASAWAGGEKGREVIDRFLPTAVQLLSPRGCIYLLLCSDNEPSEVYATMKELGGMEHHVVARRRAANERLQIVRFCRNPDLFQGRA